MPRFIALSSASVSRALSLLAIFFVSVASKKECDQTKCPGPLQYYKDLGCTPVYEHEGDCCAIKYNCDHLKSLNPDKCYVNGHEYAIGEVLKKEDANPCDIGCTCAKYDEFAAFMCAVVDCIGPREGCYLQGNPNQCCQGPEVCPEREEDRATCEVDGTIYKDGEQFTPKSNPELNCYCQPGYKGENVEPFCAKPNHPFCDPVFANPFSIYKNCAPVYYEMQDPQTGCSVFSRCQNSNDTVLRNYHSKAPVKPPKDENMTCIFGDLRMSIGDELNQNTDYDSICVKCVCEVPPYPTCQRLSDSECPNSGPKYEPPVFD